MTSVAYHTVGTAYENLNDDAFALIRLGLLHVSLLLHTTSFHSRVLVAGLAVLHLDVTFGDIRRAIVGLSSCLLQRLLPLRQVFV